MKYFLILIIPLATGCTPQTAPNVTLAEGERLFAANCATCHGANAEGSGPAASGLSTYPPDLTKIATRREGVWPMLEIMSIVDGYTKTNTPRADMPIIAELTEGPAVKFDTGNGQIRSAPARLIALTNYIESIQSPRPERYVP